MMDSDAEIQNDKKMDKNYDTLEGGIQPQLNTRHFTLWVLLSQALGLTSVVLMAVWMANYHGGFGWTESYENKTELDLMFNYHPLFMVIGMIFLYSDGMLVYRVFRNERKLFVKILHAGIQLSVVVFVGVSLKAVFQNHNGTNKANLYTLHSWVGLTTVILFGLQWLFGFMSFLFPKLSAPVRSYYLPVHQFFGVGIFAMAVGTALMGILEKGIWSMPKTYGKKPPEALLCNFLGLVILVHGIVVTYIVTRHEYRRQPLPEEESIQLTGSRD